MDRDIKIVFKRFNSLGDIDLDMEIGVVKEGDFYNMRIDTQTGKNTYRGYENISGCLDEIKRVYERYIEDKNDE